MSASSRAARDLAHREMQNAVREISRSARSRAQREKTRIARDLADGECKEFKISH